MIIKNILFIKALMLIAISAQAQNASFKKYNPCSFEIELPSSMTLNKMFVDSSPDYCDYEVKLANGTSIMELNSLIQSRFENTNIQELYEKAIQAFEFEITY